jgi:hypothetical protein
MQTLNQLQSGELVGMTQIKISEGLFSIPEALFDLADTLEVLDLSGNNLVELPDTFSKFKKLRILFLSNNKFIEFPAVLYTLEHLDIVGFKANILTHIPEKSIPISLRWLILTDNKIEQLPNSIGDCVKLQKVMLAGNCLTALPDRMALCTNIELLRLSANALNVLPSWLFKLPRLAWLAFSNNVCVELATQTESQNTLKNISWSALEIKEQLGQGASGIIYKAYWKDRDTYVAVKLYKGTVTSDGFPKDEMQACIHAGDHANLPKVLGVLSNHPDGVEGLVMDLIDSSYQILGAAPDFVTCTRDTFDSNTQFSIESIQNIFLCVTHVLAHLHEKGIMHGDLYAHNTLVNEHGKALLSDFGAATLYDTQNIELRSIIIKIEIRALGYLLDDLLQYANNTDAESYDTLERLRNRCLDLKHSERPSIEEIWMILNKKLQ